LTVEGPADKVTAFLEHAKGTPDGEETPFDFNRFIPYPEKWEQMDREREAFYDRFNSLTPAERETVPIPPDGFNSGGYDWCVENWGTKWNACRVQIGQRSEWDREVSQDLHFETAWSPPEPVIKRAAEMFPDLTLTLRYFECGCAYNGMLRCEGGEVTFDESGPYFGNRGG
jgi:hypothetical protein